jgi:hypothetical protein
MLQRNNKIKKSEEEDYAQRKNPQRKVRHTSKRGQNANNNR